MTKFLILSLFLSLFAFSTTPAFARGENKCGMAKCPKKFVQCEAGEKKVDKRSLGACCPHFVCISESGEDSEGRPDCQRAKCPKKFVQCDEGEKKVDMREEGACCPNWKCIEDEGEDDL